MMLRTLLSWRAGQLQVVCFQVRFLHRVLTIWLS
jgi:hypothetical protein